MTSLSAIEAVLLAITLVLHEASYCWCTKNPTWKIYLIYSKSTIRIEFSFEIFYETPVKYNTHVMYLKAGMVWYGMVFNKSNKK